MNEELQLLDETGKNSFGIHIKLHKRMYGLKSIFMQDILWKLIQETLFIGATSEG
jgi:hypothetical protein